MFVPLAPWQRHRPPGRRSATGDNGIGIRCCKHTGRRRIIITLGLDAAEQLGVQPGDDVEISVGRLGDRGLLKLTKVEHGFAVTRAASGPRLEVGFYASRIGINPPLRSAAIVKWCMSGGSMICTLPLWCTKED